VGGPEAGNVRVIPESHGDYIKGDNDYLYRIWPIRMPGHARTAYFACDAHQHPLDMFLEIWREYSPAAQIKRQAKEGLTYSKLGTNSPP
jgi:hypothetical protein